MDLEAIKYMPGSTGGKYFPFARKGNVLLGIQPVGGVDGGMYNLPGTTYFAYRLRSAPEGGLFADEDAAKKVHKLQANPENLWDAWPAVKKWEKRDNSRASTTTGVFLRGRFKAGYGKAAEMAPEMEALLSTLKSGALGEKVSAGLIAIAGEENLIVTKDEIIDFVNTHAAQLIAHVEKQIEHGKKLHEAADKSVGVFMVQSDLLAKVYEEVHGKPMDEPEVVSSGDNEDPEDDEANEGHDAPEDDDPDSDYL